MLPLAYEGNEIWAFPYERGMQFRVGKQFNPHWSAAFEIDQPETASVSSNLTPTALLGTENSGSNFPIGNNLPVPCCNQAFYIYPVAGVLKTRRQQPRILPYCRHCCDERMLLSLRCRASTAASRRTRFLTLLPRSRGILQPAPRTLKFAVLPASFVPAWL